MTAPHATSRSLQIFDRHGHSVHKPFVEPETDVRAFNELIGRHAAPESASLHVRRNPVATGCSTTKAAPKFFEKIRSLLPGVPPRSRPVPQPCRGACARGC